MNAYKLSLLDKHIIKTLKKIWIPAARIALAIIFIWFGGLKVLGLSPATPLVHALFDQTIPWMSFGPFYTFFGFFEVIIGVIFLIKGMERIAVLLLLIHMITTFMPLVLLPHIAWNGLFVPTLEGQYIIKNLALIAAALGVGAHLTPLQE